jgi:glycosyltransferase involved in cell wall biosynthesis
MILSICIPVFNQNIERLIKSLELQISKLPDVEIAVIDDGSDPEFKKANASLLEKHIYFENYKNKGRSAIRNQFLEKTTGEYLLFLDGDSEMVRSNFVMRYLHFITSRTRVACGGMEIPNKVEKGRELRFKYANEVEQKDFVERLEHPYEHFKTNNFIIRRDIFEKFKFATHVKGYGHEDTLMAFKFKRKRVPVDHIDNPVMHAYIDTNEEFLDKTKSALKNLAELHALRGEGFSDFVRLLSVYDRLKKKQLHILLWMISPFAIPVLTLLCKSGVASVAQFNWLKLLLFVVYRQKVKPKKS